MDVLLGLGGNLGDPPAAFRRAVEDLEFETEVCAVSSLYRSYPVGPPQPRYWNMTVFVRCPLQPLALLDFCQRLEVEAGRVRDPAQVWGPRTLDIDLLLARQIVHVSGRLFLPHAHLHRRAFALVPASEIVPHWRHPLVGETIGEMASAAVAGVPSAVEKVAPF